MKVTVKDINKAREARRKARDKQETGAVPFESYAPSLHIDTTDDMVKGLSIGDEITVVVTGIVKSVRIDSWDSNFGMDLVTIEIPEGKKKNSFEKLADELEADDDG